MKCLLISPLTSFALRNIIFANEKFSSESNDIDAKHIFLGQVISICYGVDRNHITMNQ